MPEPDVAVVEAERPEVTVTGTTVVVEAVTGPPGPQGPAGPAGADGAQGAQGPAGPEGDSAYEVAVANGFVGTESAWIASLEGDVGPTGPQGPEGPQGDQGPMGAGVDFEGEWGTGTAYQTNDAVTWEGSMYVAVQNNTNQEPTLTEPYTYWLPVAVGGTGLTGATGPEGPAGPQGSTGATGPTGPAMVWRGAWGDTTTYNPLDAVSYDGSSYVCILQNTNNVPPNATYWALIAQKGAGVNSGGTTGQVLAKLSGTNYDTTWIDVSLDLSSIDGGNASSFGAGQGLHERFAGISASSNIASVPRRELQRLSTFNPTANILSSGTKGELWLRSAAFVPTANIAAKPQRDLHRSSATTSIAGIASAGQTQGTTTLPTLYRADGFEHGRVALSGKPFDVGSGSQIFISSGVARTGHLCMDMNLTTLATANVGYTVPAGTNIVAMSFYIKFAGALPTSDATLCSISLSTASARLEWEEATGQFRASLSGNQVGGPVISADTWYRVDMEFDGTSANPTFKVKINNGTEFMRNPTGTGPLTVNNCRLGSVDSATPLGRYLYDDWLISITDGDYEIMSALTNHEIHRLKPTSDGTHSIGGANLFEISSTGTDITNSTTDAYTLVDDDFADTTPNDYINQVGNATNDYVELVFEDTPAGGLSNVADVRVDATVRESATSGNSLAKVKAYDTVTTFATLSTDVVDMATQDPGVTSTTWYKMLPRPSGGWTKTKANALRARFGYGDGDPDAWLATLVAQVVLM